MKSIWVRAVAGVLGLVYAFMCMPIYMAPSGLLLLNWIHHFSFLQELGPLVLCVVMVAVAGRFHAHATRMFFFVSIPISVVLVVVLVLASNMYSWLDTAGEVITFAVVLPVLGIRGFQWLRSQLQTRRPQKLPWLIFYTSPILLFGAAYLVGFQLADGHLPSNLVFFFALYGFCTLGLALGMSAIGTYSSRRLNGVWFWIAAVAGGLGWAVLQELLSSPVLFLYAARYSAQVTLNLNSDLSVDAFQHAIYRFASVYVPIHILFCMVHRPPIAHISVPANAMDV